MLWKSTVRGLSSESTYPKFLSPCYEIYKGFCYFASFQRVAAVTNNYDRRDLARRALSRWGHPHHHRINPRDNYWVLLLGLLQAITPMCSPYQDSYHQIGHRRISNNKFMTPRV